MKIPRLNIICLMLLIAACGGGNDTGSKPSPSPQSTRPASTAKLSIVSPTEGETIKGSSVAVKVSLTGARIVEEVTNDITPDTGHLHVILDGKTVSMTYGLEQTIPDVVAGLHALRVEFVAADHNLFNPRVIAEVSFRTEA